MRHAGWVIAGFSALGLAACATDGGADSIMTAAGSSDSGPPAAVSTIGPPRVTADLRDAQGQTRARATAETSGDSLRVRIEAVRMSPGAYGAHLHAVGRCDAPGFESAGPHWNPTGQMHGKDNPKGMHKGDLPNLIVGTDGRGSFEYTIPNAALSGTMATSLIDGDGAAVVIHALPDDFRTDPSGKSGARIACGILG
ncbi:MAG: superoxide dismutase, Cu-Zn family [Sphingomonadales bacterium]|jgi:Cu-Zn family superoxide dismutase|nr:superoxide dismutase, Cu-Zn family [Sphingomonadales bacterium]